MRLHGTDEKTGEPCWASIYGIMDVEKCELDGQPAVRCTLGNGQVCLARVETQPSAFLRRFLRQQAGIVEDE